ncbi:FapA family protein [Herbivorax sp. ANBcel31]|uniref:FapA family protein n=1 Tax=Herbivorax sp. ANBcel31 TaxID=3069754 RepID=UPI0027AE0F08|nr:FapA family protein [Herbivorax sp. ANBcel31]MDQ2085866.1 FapA family protein [Herbivorax sp. ANBcel31]
MYKSPSENPNNGYFELEFKEDGLFLTVYPPVEKGKKVEVNDILDRLAIKKVRDFKKDVIELAVLKSEKEPVKISEAQEEVKIDASVKVSVTPDKMKASIILIPPDGGKMLTIKEILSSMGEQGIKYGLDMETLENISKYPVYNESIVVAKGTPEVNGKNGSVKFHFDVEKDKSPKVDESGKVDFRHLDIIENVKKDTVLCSLEPPLPGTPGKTVAGVEIPAKDGKPAALPKGRNTKISEDGQKLISVIDGQINYISGKVNVFQNYEVPANVDNSTGNIDFIGNVIVRGNVQSGFVVEAGGNVEVWGVVEGATIVAQGDIVLRRGMQGLEKGTLKSGGSIIAKYIENSNIEAKEEIKAEAIMHSNIKCGNKLELSGKKGLLVGGTCKVGKEISVKVIGSYMSTPTDIEVGIDPSLKERYKELRSEIQTIEEDIKKADQAVTILKKFEAAGKLTPEKQQIMAKSIRTKVFYSNRANQIKEELSYIETKLEEEASGIIRANSYIYPGTKVSIGTSMLYVKDNLQYCTLYRDGADIKVGSYDK